MNKLRIAIIAHLKYPIAEPFAGGLEMHTHMLARNLRERGHDVTLFASDKSAPEIGTEAICEATELNSIGTDEAHNVTFFKEHHAYLKLMMHLQKSNYDIVHNNALHYLPIAMADSLPMPMVTTLHTPPFCWLESGFRCASGRNNTIVAVSEKTADLWSSVFNVDDVIPNGIDLTKFAFSPKPDRDPYVIWYARIVREKGLHYAIDAARMANMDIKIAGPVWDENYFRKEISPRFGPDTDYLGHVSHENLAELIAGATATVCTPCWEEPYGLVVPESLAVGVPVAAFSRGALPDIITDKSGALSEPDNAKSLAQAITKAIKCNRYDCRKRAEDVADSQRMIDHYENLYNRLVYKSTNRSSRHAHYHPATAQILRRVDGMFERSRAL